VPAGPTPTTCPVVRDFPARLQPPCRRLGSPLDPAAGLMVKESGSFLKKRTKKLLLTAGSIVFSWLNSPLNASSKSFLLLFFKKEESCFGP
jgi:hypothetical protein